MTMTRGSTNEWVDLTTEESREFDTWVNSDPSTMQGPFGQTAKEVEAKLRKDFYAVKVPQHDEMLKEGWLEGDPIKPREITKCDRCGEDAREKPTFSSTASVGVPGSVEVFPHMLCKSCMTKMRHAIRKAIETCLGEAP